jgi:hypothetical protein
VPLPELVASRLDQQSLELAHRQDVRERLARLRRPQRQRRVPHESLLLDEETEERFEGRRRPRLARDSRAAFLLIREERAQVRDADFREAVDPCPCR